MTGKLIKYEMKSSIRLVAIVWAALAVMSVFAGFFMRAASDLTENYFYNSGNIRLVAASVNVLNVLTMIVFVALFVAMIVISTIIVVTRFYKGIVGQEGYLTHTLPVTTRQIIMSRGITAALILLISSIVGCLSIAIIVLIDAPSDVMFLLKDAVNAIGRYPWIIIVIIQCVILMVISTLESVYQIYVSISVGQLVDKYRILLSLGTFMGINLIISAFSSIFFIFGAAIGVLEGIIDILENMSGFAATQAVILPSLFLEIVLLFVFHIVSEKLLKSHLNLL